MTTGTGTITSETQALTFQSAIATVQPLIRDLTTFTDYSYNGWERGPAVPDARDLSFILYNGRVNLYNNTFTNNSAGVVLKKRFTNMQVGAAYLFSVNVMRWLNAYDPPIASLRTSQNDQSNPTVISALYPNTQNLSLQIVARSADIEFQYYSNQPSGVGNDYMLTNFDVRRL